MVPNPVPARCVSCDQPLTGRYCSACGEQLVDAGARTVKHFLTTSVVDEIVHADSRFWLTIRTLIFSPGQLTCEFIAGRRRRYIGPVKLLLAAIFLFAVSTRDGFVASLFIGPVPLSIAPAAPPEGATIRETVLYIDRFGVLDRRLTEQIGPGEGPQGPAQVAFYQRIRQFAEPLSFGNVVVLGLALFLMFRRRMPLVDHLVFSTHAVSFVLLTSLAMVPATWISETYPAITTLLVIPIVVWQFSYMTAAIRRVYLDHVTRRGRARLHAFGLAWVVYLLNGGFVTAVQMLAGWLAIRAI